MLVSSHPVTSFSFTTWSVIADLFCCSSIDRFRCLVNLLCPFARPPFYVRSAWWQDIFPFLQHRPCHSSCKNAITDHVVKENHVTGWHEASILGREGNHSARWIRESIEISKQDIQGHTMNGHIPCHISTTHFSPQQRHLAEKIRTGSRFDKGNRCRRNVNNKNRKGLI